MGRDWRSAEEAMIGLSIAPRKFLATGSKALGSWLLALGYGVAGQCQEPRAKSTELFQMDTFFRKAGLRNRHRRFRLSCFGWLCALALGAAVPAAEEGGAEVVPLPEDAPKESAKPARSQTAAIPSEANDETPAEPAAETVPLGESPKEPPKAPAKPREPASPAEPASAQTAAIPPLEVRVSITEPAAQSASLGEPPKAPPQEPPKELVKEQPKPPGQHTAGVPPALASAAGTAAARTEAGGGPPEPAKSTHAGTPVIPPEKKGE